MDFGLKAVEWWFFKIITAIDGIEFGHSSAKYCRGAG